MFHVLEPVKECKEIAEARVKNGGDKPLLTILNLSDYAVTWNMADSRSEVREEPPTRTSCVTGSTRQEAVLGS